MTPINKVIPVPRGPLPFKTKATAMLPPPLLLSLDDGMLKSLVLHTGSVQVETNFETKLDGLPAVSQFATATRNCHQLLF